MKRILLCLLLTGCSHGQVHVENDYFAYFHKNHDRYYTNGVKFSAYQDTENQRETYSLGQSIYTPSRKSDTATPEELRKDRPYAGWLYGEYRKAVREDTGRTVLGIQAGCTGRCSFAKETQNGIHKLLGQGHPTWDKDFSLKSEPGIILEAERYYDLVQSAHFHSDYFGLLKVGNIIDSASLGTSLKYGVNFAAWEPEPVIFKVPNLFQTFREEKEPEPWSYYVFGSTEARFIAYNHLLEGSLFQKERHTVEAERIVGEANLGIRVGYKNLKLSYNYAVITNEFEHQKGPLYWGGLDVSW